MMPFLDDTQASVGGLAPQADIGPDGPTPDFLTETLPAAFRDGNVIGALAESARDWGPRSPFDQPEAGFDPFADIAGYEEHAASFRDAETSGDVARVKAKINRERQDRDTLAASGWQGMVAGLASGLVDPINLVPVGGAVEFARSGLGVAKAVGAGATAGLAASTASEALLHGVQETRSREDSGKGIAFATLLSGVLGGAGALLPAGVNGRTGARSVDQIATARSAHMIADDVRAKLLAAGRAPEQAETEAALWSSFFGSFVHERAGLDPMKVYRDLNLDIRGAANDAEPPAPGRVLSQPVNAGVDLGREMTVVEVPRVARTNSADERKAAKNARKDTAPVDLDHPDMPGQPVHLSSSDWVHAVASWNKSVEAIGERGAALAHLDASRLLPDLFRASALVESHLDRKADPEVAQVHRFFAAISHGGDTYAVKLTVEEHVAGRKVLLVDGVEKLDKLHDMHLAKKLPAEGVRGEPVQALRPDRTTTTPPLERTGPVVDIRNSLTLGDLIRGIKGEDGEVYLQPDGARPPRGSVTLGDGATIVHLLRTADSSTFMHESGHIWLDMVRKVADAEGSTSDVKALWSDIRAALGVPEGESLSVTHHEQFARSFEAYLHEGKPPSATLAGVFERFKAWLVAVYAHVRNLGVELSDDMRSVFDRMLATDEEIATAQASNGAGKTDMPSSMGGSVGAAAARDTTLAQETLKGAMGAEDLPIIRGQDPLMRAAHSPSVEVRRAMQDLAEHPLFFAKNAEGIASPVAVETRVKMWDAPLAQALSGLDDLFVQYRLGRNRKLADVARIGTGDLLGRRPEGMLGRKQFAEEVGRALRRGDSHPIPEVAEAARLMRAQVFDPGKDKAIAAGLLPEDVTVETAASYLTRLYDTQRIAARRPEFEGRIVEWLSGLKASAGERLRAAESRIAGLEPEVQALEADLSRLAGTRGEDGFTPGEVAQAERRWKALGNTKRVTERAWKAATRESRRMAAHAERLGKRAEAVAPTPGLDKGDPFRPLLRDLRRGGPKAPPSLADWVRANGGLVDEGGDVRALGLNDHRMANGKSGMALEDAARRAREAGYFSGHGADEEVSVDDFLWALKDDATGAARRHRDEDLDTLAYLDYLADLRRELDEKGLDLGQPDARLKAMLEAGGEDATRFRADTPAARARAREAAFHQRRAEDLRGKAEAREAEARARLDEVSAQREQARLDYHGTAAIRADVEKELAGLRRALDRARRARDSDRGLAAAEPVELRDSAREIADKLLALPAGRIPYEAVPLVRGPLRERTLSIPDAMIEDFLESDAEVVARHYMHTLAPDVELAAKFGRADMQDQLDKVRAEYARLREGVTDEKALARLHARERRDLEDLSAVRDRLRGSYALPRDPQGLAVRVFRVVRNLNYLRLLGGMTVSSLADAARPVIVHGLQRTVGDGLAPLVRDLRGFRLAAGEAQLAGAALDLVLDSRAMKLADVWDDYGRNSKFERGVQALASQYGLVTLMAPWNAGWKSCSAVISQTRMLQAVERYADLAPGTGGELERLAWLGIDQNAAERIAVQFRAHGRKMDSGIWWANTGEWTDAEAADAFRAALLKDVDRTIITPGQDKPLWMSSELGKIMGQFKTFSMVSTQRVALAGLQQRDAAVLNGALMSVGFGMLSYALASAAAGRDTSDDPARWVAEGFDRSGLLFWLSDVAGTGGKVLGLGTTSRYGSRSSWEALLGPSAGLASDLSQVVGAAGRGDWRGSDTHAARKMVPWQNLIGVRRIFDEAEEGINDALGVPMGRRRSER